MTDRVALVFAKALGLILSQLPISLLENITEFLAWVFMTIPNSRKRLLLSNLTHAFPEWKYPKILSLAKESSARMFEMGFFSLCYPFMSRDGLRHTVYYDDDTEAKLEELRKTGKPVLMLIPHTCLFETLATSPFFRPHGGRSLGAIYRPNKNPHLDKWITRARCNVGIIPFSRKEGIIKARSHLKKGNWLAVLFDQNAGEYGTIYPFLDRVCSMSILPNILVRKSDVIPVICIAQRISFFRSKLLVQRIDDKKEKLHVGSHEILGDLIKNDKNGFPDWLWSHGKWKTNERPHEILKLIPRKLGLPPKECLARKLKIWLRLPNWLGDIIMAIPVIRLIRDERPDCELTVFVKEQYVYWLKGLGIAEVVVGLPPKSPKYFCGLLPFRKHMPEFQLLFTNSFRGDLEAIIFGARYRMGIEYGRRRFLLNHPVRKDLSKSTHLTFQWKRLAEAGGCTKGLNLEPFNKNRKDSRSIVIGIAPGSNNTPSKRVPLTIWSSLINLVLDSIPCPIHIRLLGTPKDSSICDSIMADCRKSFFQNLCGRTSLTELDQEIQGLDLLLCSDSGAMHLANFRGTPVFAIFGPTSPNITGPIFEAPNSIAEVSSKNFRRVSELDLKEMSEKLESFLKKEILTRCK